MVDTEIGFLTENLFFYVQLSVSATVAYEALEKLPLITLVYSFIELLV